MSEQSEESSESNPLSTTPVKDLDGGQLVEEQRELANIVHHEYAPHIHDWHEDAVDRLEAVWAEIRTRSDTMPPECPECGGSQWKSVVDENARCANCDHGATGELQKKVVSAWDTMLEEIAS